MEMSGRSTVAAAPAAAERDLEVAVIGAGPHGLSAAAHLRRAGMRFVSGSWYAGSAVARQTARRSSGRRASGARA
jgi:threonine dehydrogenase-like Zn-dependent dehydrogenase